VFNQASVMAWMCGNARDTEVGAKSIHHLPLAKNAKASYTVGFAQLWPATYNEAL
jgi:hypothetical protein